MSLAATEVLLQLHYRVASRSADPLQSAALELLQSIGEESTPEELVRVAVFLNPLPPVDMA